VLHGREGEIVSYLQPVGYADNRPLPTNNYIPSVFYGDVIDAEYAPALLKDPLDALQDGLRKYLAVKRICSDRLMDLARQYLECVFSVVFVDIVQISRAEAYERLDLDKNPGFPYYFVAPDKARAIQLYEVDYIVEQELMFGNQETIYSTTLKSEMRDVEKFPRLFTPAPLHSTVVGNQLYGAQNDAIQDTRNMHPIKLGVSMPGHEFTTLFFGLPSDFHKAHFDIKGCDVSVCLSIIAVIRDFRAKHIAQQFIKGHKAYYSKVYCGFVYVLGRIIQLLGQRSGSTLTFTDNSFFVLCIVYSAFCELTGVPMEKATTDLVVVDGSDDAMLAWHSRYTSLFNIVTLANFLWKNFGVILESPAINPVSIQDLYFFSQHLVSVSLPHLNIDVCWIAAGNKEKILSGFRYVKGVDLYINFQRFAALLTVLFPYYDEFCYWRKKVLSEMKRVHFDDIKFRRLASLISSDLFFLKIYLGVQVEPTGLRRYSNKVIFSPVDPRHNVLKSLETRIKTILGGSTQDSVF